MLHATSNVVKFLLRNCTEDDLLLIALDYDSGQNSNFCIVFSLSTSHNTTKGTESSYGMIFMNQNILRSMGSKFGNKSKDSDRGHCNFVSHVQDKRFKDLKLIVADLSAVCEASESI